MVTHTRNGGQRHPWCAAVYDQKVACQLREQAGTTPFTDFGGVTPDTALESLDLNWAEQDLPEEQRTKHVHRLHPYLGKFVPQLVEVFLRKFQPSLVYDPFCGSGTTLVEAKTLGVDSVGTDISLFNVLLSRVKTGEYDTAALEGEAGTLLYQLPDHPTRNLLFSPVATAVATTEYLDKWFSPRTLGELRHYQKLARGMAYADLFNVVLTRSARSARLVPHFDLDFPKQPQTESYECYKHGRVCRPTDEAAKFLRRYTIDAVERVKQFQSLQPSGKATVIHGDSRTVDLPFGIDLVVTSPPYVGMIDYHEQHRYAYELLGLEDNTDLEIGTASGGTSKQAITDYETSINSVFSHTREFMAENAIMVIVVNDQHGLYNAAKVGFREIARLERHVNRRTGRRAGVFHENVLIWAKE